MAFLQIQGVSKQYGGLWALANVTFDVAQGEIVSVIGPNGAGKTTLFDCLTGFCRQTRAIFAFATPTLRSYRPIASTPPASPAPSSRSACFLTSQCWRTC